MPIEVQIRNDIAIATPGGNLVTAQDTRAFRDALQQLQATGARKVVLDLGNVALASPASIGVITDLNDRLAAAGGRLVLCNVAGVRETLLAAGVLMKILACPSLEEGVGALR